MKTDGSPPHGGNDATKRFLQTLRESIGPQRYELWIEHRLTVALRDGVLTLGVANQFVRDWLQTHFTREIEEAAAAFGLYREIRFELLATNEKEDAQPRKQTQHRDEQRNKTAKTSTQQPPKAPDRPHGVARRFADFDEFVEGAENRLALATCRLAAECAGQVSPVVMYGPSGVGKTHLLEAVWREVKRRRPTAMALLTSAEQFTAQFLGALHGGGAPQFRHRFRRLDVLLLDDVQFFVGKKATLVELHHTIDELLRLGKQVVVASDRPPSELAGLGPELQARLGGGATCPLAPPQFETRRSILRNQFDREQIAVDDAVVTDLAGQLARHARQLQGAVFRVKASQLAGGQPATLENVRAWTADLVVRTPEVFELAEVEAALCDVLQVERRELKSKSRARPAAEARMLAMWLSRRYTRAALSEIGVYYGGRRHSTVISAEKTVERWRTARRVIGSGRAAADVEETIRRVEFKLKAG